MRIAKILFPSLLTLMIALPAGVRADTLSAFKAVLAREATAPVRGQVVATTRSVEGEGKDAEQRLGSIEAGVADDARGLRIEFAPDFLRRTRTEEAAKAQDPKAPTPLLDGVDALGPKVLRDILVSAPRLQLLLQRATLSSERDAPWKGRPATVLTFSLAREKLAGRDAEYVKSYTGSLEVWVGADGAPLAAQLHEVFSGRAMMFFTFEVVKDDNLEFAMVGDRLLTTSSVSKLHNTGTAGDQTTESNIRFTPAG